MIVPLVLDHITITMLYFLKYKQNYIINIISNNNNTYYNYQLQGKTNLSHDGLNPAHVPF